MEKDSKVSMLVPKTFAIGIDKHSAGFPTMKSKDGKWSNVSVFEKHCGFKPWVQRDSRKEIEKALAQQVQEVSNFPTSGFKLVKLGSKVYSTELYRDIACAVLEDPRGWWVQVPLENLQKLLDENGMNLKDGVLEGVELMYAWPERRNAPFSLEAASEKTLAAQAATEESMNKQDSIVWVKPSQLEVGGVYSAKAARGLHMYMGKHAVYSDECHFKAVMEGSYSSLQDFIDDRQDMTNVERHVFYRLSMPDTGELNSWSLHSNTLGVSPYFAAGNVSKLFTRAEEGIDLSAFSMHNDRSKPVALASVEDDMAHSLLFNMVDFEKSIGTVPVSYQLLEDMFGLANGDDDELSAAMKAFPFWMSSEGVFLQSSSWKDFRINSYDYDGYCRDNGKYIVERARKRGEYGWSSRTCLAEYKFGSNSKKEKKSALKQLHDEIKPYVKQYVLENGNLVPEHQNIMLNKRTAYHGI